MADLGRVRAGSKGILFYVVLFQQAQSYDPATGAITEKARKTMADVKKNNWPITQKRFETNNPSSLTYVDGSPVPQAQSVIKAYGQLQEIEALLLSLKISDLPYAFGAFPAALQSFRKDGVDSEIYCVAVNDDFNQARELELSLLPNVRKAINVISGAELAITPDINSKMQLAKIKLDAGDGAMLKLTLGEDAAGMLLFSEDFSHACCSVKLENASRSQVFRPFNMGYHWCVRKDADKGKVNMDQQASITIEGLAEAKTRRPRTS